MRWKRSNGRPGVLRVFFIFFWHAFLEASIFLLSLKLTCRCIYTNCKCVLRPVLLCLVPITWPRGLTNAVATMMVTRNSDPDRFSSTTAPGRVKGGPRALIYQCSYVECHAMVLKICSTWLAGGPYLYMEGSAVARVFGGEYVSMCHVRREAEYQGGHDHGNGH